MTCLTVNWYALKQSFLEAAFYSRQKQKLVPSLEPREFKNTFKVICGIILLTGLAVYWQV